MFLIKQLRLVYELSNWNSYEFAPNIIILFIVLTCC